MTISNQQTQPEQLRWMTSTASTPIVWGVSASARYTCIESCCDCHTMPERNIQKDFPNGDELNACCARCCHFE
jgi:hypothetical protein